MMSSALVHQTRAGTGSCASAGITRWSVDHPTTAAAATMVMPLSRPVTVASAAGPGLARAPASWATSAEFRWVTGSRCPFTGRCVGRAVGSCAVPLCGCGAPIIPTMAVGKYPMRFAMVAAVTVIDLLQGDLWSASPYKSYQPDRYSIECLRIAPGPFGYESWKEQVKTVLARLAVGSAT
ncbi:hypothetical protein GCM10027610_027530 [Dactylosporangium cerinum]